MRKFFRSFLLVAVSLALLTATSTFAQGIKPSVSTAIIPALRTNPKNWVQRHEDFVEIAKQGNVDLLFLGDSITDFWRRHGSNVWNQYYAPRHAANFGISGDRTEHVLWRIDHGELSGLKPKVVVLLIGTNNGKTNSPAEIADAIRLILAKIQTKMSDPKILLLGVFPRNRTNDTPAEIEAPPLINALIAKYDNDRTIRFLNINDRLVGPDGKVPADIMPDFLHPNEHGYQIWAEAMEPTLTEMLK